MSNRNSVSFESKRAGPGRRRVHRVRPFCGAAENGSQRNRRLVRCVGYAEERCLPMAGSDDVLFGVKALLIHIGSLSPFFFCTANGPIPPLPCQLILVLTVDDIRYFDWVDWMLRT